MDSRQSKHRNLLNFKLMYTVNVKLTSVCFFFFGLPVYQEEVMSKSHEVVLCFAFCVATPNCTVGYITVSLAHLLCTSSCVILNVNTI